MLHSLKLHRPTKAHLLPHKTLTFFLNFSSSVIQSQTQIEIQTQKIVKLINDHPFPDHPLLQTLTLQIPSSLLSPPLVESVLGRLFASHSNGLKAHQFFQFSLQTSNFPPTQDAFEKTVHILSRMRYFDRAWELMEEISRSRPQLLTLKSMSILLSRIARFLTYEETLEAFERMEKSVFVGKPFGVEEFNVLIRAFCTQREMKEARSIFNKMADRFQANAKTMNILLLGFKQTGDITSVELFYHEMVKRGFKPDSVTYSIRINAYCKKGHLSDGLRLVKEMELANLLPTVETMSTLIHGAGVARNIAKARDLFDEIATRGLVADTGAYNALLSCFVRSRDAKAAAELMGEMEEKGVGYDNVTYHTMFLVLMRAKDMDSVVELYEKMAKRGFVPKTRTVVLLMKWFCKGRRPDLGLELWGYLLERGHCPHSHALDLLATGLCAHEKVGEAFDCAKQMVERGRHMSEVVYRMLERFLVQGGEMEKLRELNELIKRLHKVLPPSRGHATGILSTHQKELA